MDWVRDLKDWPLSNLSRRIIAKPHQWHVQETGSGPTLLLLHGAGATTHSWRDMIPLLAQSYHIIALDLPGHGFTRIGRPRRSGLPEMTADIAGLCSAQGWQPQAIIGHSAGAAVALSLAENLTPAPAIIGINAALGRFDGVAGWLFPLLAKLLALNPLTSFAFTMGRDPISRARRLIEGTGSVIPDEGLRYYAKLVSDRAHVDGTLRMMSQWNVDRLDDALPQIASPCLLIAAKNDSAVAPRISRAAAERMPNATFLELPDLGHLAHEEDPARIARLIKDWLADLNGSDHGSLDDPRSDTT